MHADKMANSVNPDQEQHHAVEQIRRVFDDNF